MFLFDAHLDLAMNALEWNRDLRQSVADIRAREEGMKDKPDRGQGTVSLPALRQGHIGLVVATQIARHVHLDNSLPGWHSPHQAYAQTQGQLAWYRAMEAAGEMKQIRTLIELEAHLLAWKADPAHCPIGFVLSLEGADSMVNLSYVEQAWQQGLRAIGPAHYGPGTYAQGTDANGGIGEQGRQLLREMERLNIILDATHLCDESFWEAMDHFQGPVWASHSNSRSVVPHHRQFSDEQYKELLSRGAVIGMALDTWMMVPGWKKHQTTHQELPVYLHHILDHLDHVCQLAGNAEQVGLGTDLDGGFGREQSPCDLDSIADLHRISDLLAERGYKASDIEGILHGNWLRFLRRVWG